MGKPAIYDLETLWAAGINPKTRLPVRFSAPFTSKEDIKKFLRLCDEQDAVNRFKWTNLPASISSQELERMIYYKGQLAFFYFEETGEYYFMPYALDGTIDFYGRYNRVHPVPMTSGNENEDKANQSQTSLLSQKKLYPCYDEEKTDRHPSNESCVLLHDYTKQLSQTIIPRKDINDPLLDAMSDCIPYMKTALLIGTGVNGIRVQDADQAENVKEASRSLQNAALTNQPYMPIVGSVEFQELANGNLFRAAEFMQAMQSIDNLRLSGYGLENGGLFEKKAHLNDSENALNSSGSSLKMTDGLEIRKRFCDIANKLFGLDMQVEAVQAQSEMGVADMEDQEGGEEDADASEQDS